MSVPVLTSISPNFIEAGHGSDFIISATGTGFVGASVIQWNGSPLVTVPGGPTSLTATVPFALVATASTAFVTVFTPGGGGGTSAAQSFYISFPTPAEDPVGLLYRDLQNIRSVGAELNKSDPFFRIPGTVGPGNYAYRTIELPLNYPYYLTQQIDVQFTDSNGNPTGTHLVPTYVNTSGPLGNVQQGHFVIKVGTLDGDDTFKFGFITLSLMDAGSYVQVSYWGRGSLVWADDVKNLNKGLSLLPGTIRPGHISTIDTDDFLFPRDVYAIGNIHLNGDLICSKVVQSTLTEITTTDELLKFNSEATSPTASKMGLVFGRGGQDPSFEWIEADSAFEFFKANGSLLLEIGDSFISMPGGFNVHGYINTDAYFSVNRPAAGPITLDPSLQIYNTAGGQKPSLLFMDYSHGSSSTGHGTIISLNANGTPTSPLPVVNNDQLFEMSGGGWDGAAFIPGGHLFITANENWSISAHGETMSLDLCTKGMTQEARILTALADSSSVTGKTWNNEIYVTNIVGDMSKVSAGFPVTGTGIQPGTTVQFVVPALQHFDCNTDGSTAVLTGFSSTTTLIPGMSVGYSNPAFSPGSYIVQVPPDCTAGTVVINQPTVQNSTGDKVFYLVTPTGPQPTDPGPSVILSQQATATGTVSIIFSDGPRVCIGDTTPTARFDVNGRIHARGRITVGNNIPAIGGPSVQVYADGGGQGQGAVIAAVSYSNESAILLGKAQGSFASPSALTMGDNLGKIFFGGAPSAGGNIDLQNFGALIMVSATENWSATAHGSNYQLFLTQPTTVNPVRVMYSDTLGGEARVVIGPSAPSSSSAILELSSTDRGFLGPRMANPSSDITGPLEGLLAYNLTGHKYQFYNGSLWADMGTGGGGSGVAPVQEDTVVLIGNSPQSVFPIATPLTITSMVDVYVNGMIQPSSTYTFSISPAQVTLATPRTTGETVTILVYATGGSGGGTALNLATTGSPVDVSLASPPTTGQVLTATNSTHATWQSLVSGPAPSLQTTTSPVVVSGAVAPSTGQVLTALTATTASWQTPAGGSLGPGTVGAIPKFATITTIGDSILSQATTYSIAVVPSSSNYGQINLVDTINSKTSYLSAYDGGLTITCQTGSPTFTPFRAHDSDGYVLLYSNLSTVPSQPFSVADNKFSVDANGGISSIRNVSYTWPTSQGSAGTLLVDNGSGGLSWSYYYDRIDPLGNSGGGTVTVNWALGLVATVTLTGSPTIAFSSPVVGQVMTLFLTQDVAGSHTVTWPSIKWPGGTPPVLTSTGNSTDIISIFWDGASYWGFVGGQNY